MGGAGKTRNLVKPGMMPTRKAGMRSMRKPADVRWMAGTNPSSGEANKSGSSVDILTAFSSAY
jgi:hypothetical protein